MYSYACSRTARSKVSGVLSDVMITILGRDSPARIRASTSRPVTFGIQISRNARSKLVCWILRNASAPSFTAVTAYPAFLSMLEMAKRVVRSSSATRIFAGAWMSSMEITLSDSPRKGPVPRPNATSIRLIGQPKKIAPPWTFSRWTFSRLHEFLGCTKMIASSELDNLNRGAVSTPSSLNPPTDYDLPEFLDLSLNLLCIAGVDGYFKYVNPAWETTLGYSQRELLSRPYLDFVHPNDREATIAEASQIVAGRSTISFENRYLCKDGSFKWLLWWAVAHPERGLIYAAGIDCTDRKREEARLGAQHAVTRVLAEAPTLAKATPRILQAICESLDWSVGSIWRRDPKHSLLRCVELWHSPSTEVKEFDWETRSRTFAQGVGLPGRVWLQAAPVWIEDVTRDSNFPRSPIAAREDLHAAFGFPILLGTEVLGVLEFFSHKIQKPDTRLLEMLSAIGSQIGQFIERMEAEDALRVYARDLESARTRAEQATRAKSEFLANISHEIRTPMNAMIGMTELALGTHITREQREYLNAIQNSANTLLTLINDLLDFSKISPQAATR